MRATNTNNCVVKVSGVYLNATYHVLMITTNSQTVAEVEYLRGGVEHSMEKELLDLHVLLQQLTIHVGKMYSSAPSYLEKREVAS